MKKLNIDEVKTLPVLKRGRYSVLHLKMTELQVGEGLNIEKGIDWKGKRTPHQLVRRFAKKHGWKMRLQPTTDKKGWIAIREK